MAYRVKILSVVFFNVIDPKVFEKHFREWAHLIAEKIIAKEANYVLSVKENHPKLLEDIK